MARNAYFCAESKLCSGKRKASRLVTVGLGLVGTRDLDADVVGLVRAELSEDGAELTDVEAGDLLIELLGEEVDIVLVPALFHIPEEVKLGKDLVGERA